MEVAGVLKKAQMLPLPLYGIMHWTEVIRVIQKTRARHKIDRQMKFARGQFIGGKGHFFDLPGCLQA
jgi:hypothetical protein